MKRILNKRVKIVLSAMSLTALCWMIPKNYQFVRNHSESLPLSWVLIKKNKLPESIDDIFVFWVRNNSFYKDKDVKFIKLIGGLPGDKIETAGGDIYFSNNLLPHNISRETCLTHKEMFNIVHSVKLTDPQEFQKRKIKIIDKKVYVANKLIGIAKPYTKKYENFILEQAKHYNKSKKYNLKYDLNAIDK